MISETYSKKFCKEDISLIENYEQAINDKEVKWVCHHKLEIREGYGNSVNELKMMGLYFNRPACELIFLKPQEHTRIHNKANVNLGKNFRDSEVQRNNAKRAWCKLRGIDTEDPIAFYDAHKHEKFKIVYGKQTNVAGKNNPMWGKNAWEISCSKKTEEEIQNTRDSKRAKMKSFWSSEEGIKRKKQVAEKVSKTKAWFKYVSSKLESAIHNYITSNNIKINYEEEGQL
jgi:hypothetical protein